MTDRSGGVMPPLLDALLEIVDSDPLPSGHTSSHWREYGRQTVVERRAGTLTLRASGFETVDRMSFRGRILHGLERLSYRSATAQLKPYTRIWGLARRLADDLSAHPNFYVLKSACALAVLVEHWDAHGISPRTFALIGDGYGFLGALIRRWLPDARLYCIDLPKTLVFQVRTHATADPGATTSLLSGSGPVRETEIVFVLPQAVEDITETIDCAINIASMGEMSDSSIRSYFTFLRRRSAAHSRFYCVNRLRKELPGGEVTDFHTYPWRSDDEIFIDGPCPYYRYFFSPSTRALGPRLFGVRVPYINYFDGVMMHRLVHLTP